MNELTGLHPNTARALNEQQARHDHCMHLVQNLRPGPCGYDTVKIEPCEIECEHCGRGVAGINWDDIAAEWNDGLPAGTPPNIVGYV